jgi:hypothetical protein
MGERRCGEGSLDTTPIFTHRKTIHLSARFSPVAFQFERKGIIRVSPVASFATVDDTATPPTIESGNDEEQLFETLFELVVEAGAEDVRLINAEEEGGEGDKLVFEVRNYGGEFSYTPT